VVGAPPGGAQIVRSGPTKSPGAKPEPGAPPAPSKTPSAGAGPPAAEGDGGAKKLNYPFTLLEITENVVLSSQHTPEPAL